MYSIGIDSGSTTTKGVLFDGHQIIERILMPTGVNPRRTIEDVYMALKKEDAYIVTTGYGRALLSVSDKQVTEITCHGVGASFLDCDVRGVIDIGGQDSKVIQLDFNQNINDFLMNDKCAAGTGRFIEVITRLLQIDLCDFDAYVRDVKSVKISSMCTVFAESEVVSLMAQDVSGPSIAKGIIESVSQRTVSLASRLSLEGKVFFSGGLAQVDSIRKCIENGLGLEVVTHEDAQYLGAIGAALIGNRYLNR